MTPGKRFFCMVLCVFLLPMLGVGIAQGFTSKHFFISFVIWLLMWLQIWLLAPVAILHGIYAIVTAEDEE